MNRKTIIILVLLFLTGCGRKVTSELQSFEGITVATLQTPFSLMDEAAVTEIAVSLPGSEETPPPIALEPTHAPGDIPEMTANPTQTSLNPYQFETTQPTQPPYGFESTTITPLPSTTPVFSLTPSPTLEIGVWEGTWNIWYQRSNGDYSASVMTAQVIGTQFSATAVINNISYTFTGNIIAQGSEVEGEWTSLLGDGLFWFQMNSNVSFVGSREYRFGFCGDRDAVNRPESCGKLPPY